MWTTAVDRCTDRRFEAVTDTGPAVWGVRTSLIVALGCGTVALAAWLVFAGSPRDQVVAGAGVLLSALAAAVLITMRRRLTADSAGLTIRGPGGSRRVRWDQVVAIGAPTRRRRGLASTSLELDLDDDGLILFGKTELGADPAEVATELRRLWHPAL